MDNKNDSKLKKNIKNGMAAAGGAALGAGAAMFFTEEAHAESVPVQEEVETEAISPLSATPTSSHPHHSSNHPADTILPIKTGENPNPTLEVEPIGVIAPHEVPIDPPFLGEEVEVVDYHRIMNEDGQEIDIANVIVNGNEVKVIDVNLDGYADMLAHDVNHNGIIEVSEIQDIEHTGVSMEPLQEAAGFDPYLYSLNGIQPDPDLPEYHNMMIYDDPLAQDDLPDYVNDADIDSFMA